MAVQIGEGQPLVAGDDRFGRGVQRAEDVEQQRQRAGQVRDIGAARLVALDLEAAAFAGHCGQHRVIFAVELARHSL